MSNPWSLRENTSPVREPAAVFEQLGVPTVFVPGHLVRLVQAEHIHYLHGVQAVGSGVSTFSSSEIHTYYHEVFTIQRYEYVNFVSYKAMIFLLDPTKIEVPAAS